jgi:hypothetical protein
MGSGTKGVHNTGKEGKLLLHSSCEISNIAFADSVNSRYGSVSKRESEGHEHVQDWRCKLPEKLKYRASPGRHHRFSSRCTVQIDFAASWRVR